MQASVVEMPTEFDLFLQFGKDALSLHKDNISLIEAQNGKPLQLKMTTPLPEEKLLRNYVRSSLNVPAVLLIGIGAVPEFS